jgi:hypothetical protein
VLGLLATIIVMWFSRQREFRADAGGARLAGRQHMIGALERLKQRHAGPLPDKMAAWHCRQRGAPVHVAPPARKMRRCGRASPDRRRAHLAASRRPGQPQSRACDEFDAWLNRLPGLAVGNAARMSDSGTAIVWFRRDCGSDNPAVGGV